MFAYITWQRNDEEILIMFFVMSSPETSEGYLTCFFHVNCVHLVIARWHPRCVSWPVCVTRHVTCHSCYSVTWRAPTHSHVIRVELWISHRSHFLLRDFCSKYSLTSTLWNAILRVVLNLWLDKPTSMPVCVLRIAPLVQYPHRLFLTSSYRLVWMLVLNIGSMSSTTCRQGIGANPW